MKEPFLICRTIDHNEQRYPTWADWEVDSEGNILISVSELPATVKQRREYNFLSAIHELVEVLVAEKHGVTQKMVDDFDTDYENRRMAGIRLAICGCEITDDPGSDIHAPYKAAHHVAEQVEYGLAKLLGVDPKEYDAGFIALDGGVAGNRK